MFIAILITRSDLGLPLSKIRRFLGSDRVACMQFPTSQISRIAHIEPATGPLNESIPLYDYSYRCAPGPSHASVISA